MPALRYFIVVGGALLALLLLADAWLPSAPIVSRNAVDRTTVRTQSTQKWPEAVVFETRFAAAVSQPSVAAEADRPDVDRLREAFAQMPPVRTVPRRVEAATLAPAVEHRQQRTIRIARKPTRQRVAVSAPDPVFGFFGSH